MHKFIDDCIVLCLNRSLFIGECGYNSQYGIYVIIAHYNSFLTHRNY